MCLLCWLYRHQGRAQTLAAYLSHLTEITGKSPWFVMANCVEAARMTIVSAVTVAGGGLAH